MRYSVHYHTNDRNWVVTDVSNSYQVMGVHASKADAYRQAFAEQERWRKYDPVANNLERIRQMLPRSLVIS